MVIVCLIWICIYCTKIAEHTNIPFHHLSSFVNVQFLLFTKDFHFQIERGSSLKSMLKWRCLDVMNDFQWAHPYRSCGILGVSQSRVKLLQSHYFKHTTSAAEVLFQCPAYLEFYRARRTSFGEISRLHMCRLCGLKIPTMLCARTNFPKSVAENVRRGLSYDAHLHTC